MTIPGHVVLWNWLVERVWESLKVLDEEAALKAVSCTGWKTLARDQNPRMLIEMSPVKIGLRKYFLRRIALAIILQTTCIMLGVGEFCILLLSRDFA